MFRCEKCGKLSVPGEKAHKLVTGKRERIYNVKDRYGETRQVKGWEIEKEITVCINCLN